jgi:iron-sulfur cluster assembly protein
MITLTEAAIRHINQFLAKRGKGIGMRVSTTRYGCSGLGYVVDYVDEQPNEFLFEFDNGGIVIFVDPKDYVYLNGLTLDYVQRGLTEGFDFINPNQTGSCGCGESFSVDIKK